MQESLVQILSPKKRVDILRDAMEAKRKGKPYTIVFCGVNGVGKSTNLAKVWKYFFKSYIFIVGFVVASYRKPAWNIFLKNKTQFIEIVLKNICIFL